MRREYVSPVRAAGRADTRGRVVRAASDLFAELGYTATTLRMVAERAGTSLERVSAAGGKAGLLLAAYQEAIDQDETTDLTSHRDIAPAWATGDRRAMVQAVVSYVASTNARATALSLAWAEARKSSALLDAAYRARMDDMRAAGRAAIVDMVAQGLVRASIDVRDAADRFWAAAHPANYELLVDVAGWSPEKFEHALLELALALLPAP